MASILDRYGIKEVADVTFYRIDSNGQPAEPVLYLDTLKVSTIEETAETADARGGKGNPKLITWDYGKEITVNLEDALFSPKSMSIMLGNSTVTSATERVSRTAVVRSTSASKLPSYFVADVLDTTNNTANRTKVYMDNDPHNDGVNYAAATSAGLLLTHVYSATGSAIQVSGGDITSIAAWNSAQVTAEDKYFVTYTLNAFQKTITITGDSFPGTYYVTGDTYARSDIDGSDQFFQFIIPKAKITSQNTITLQAEGDPSTFTMNLTVLRPEDGEMMKLVQYDLKAG